MARGEVDDGFAEVEGSSGATVAASRWRPHSLPSTPGDGATSLARPSGISQAAATSGVIHPLGVMLLHPRLRYHLVVTGREPRPGMSEL